MPTRQADRPSGESLREGDAAYFAAIEVRFQQLRGSPILVSPRDWQRIASWQERGIPREVVIRGIEAAFRRKEETGGRGSIRSLAYCEPFILELWKRRRTESVTRRDGHRGTAGGWEPGRVRDHLLAVREGLLRTIRDLHPRRPDLAARLREFADGIGREAGGLDPGASSRAIRALEERLDRMEGEMAAAGGAALTPEEDRRIQDEVERDLAAYRPAMSEETYRETRRVLLEDRIRRFFTLPRLSLFHLP